MKKKPSRLFGPFGESQANAERFGNNLFSSYLLSTTLQRIESSKSAYEKAREIGSNPIEIEQRAIEIEAYECSLSISYNLFEDDGYVS